MVSPSATRYCLPPVLMIAYTVASFEPVKTSDFTRIGPQKKAPEPRRHGEKAETGRTNEDKPQRHRERGRRTGNEPNSINDAADQEGGGARSATAPGGGSGG